MKLEDIRKLCLDVAKEKDFTHADINLIDAVCTLLPKFLAVAEAAKDTCCCVGLGYQGGHIVQCLALQHALAALEGEPPFVEDAEKPNSETP